MGRARIAPETASSAVTTPPPTGFVDIAIEPSTSVPYTLKSDGTVVSLKGDTGATGATPPLATTAPLNVGQTAAAGTSTTASRSDHVHANADKQSTVNILDYGADPSGTNASDTALTNAIAALPAGGTVLLSGTIRLSGAPYIVSANNIELRGAGPNATTLKTTATTGDQIRFTGYGCAIRNMSIQGPGTGTTSNKTAGIGVDMQSTEGEIANCNFAYQYDALNIGGFLVDVEDCFVRYFTHSGIVVNHNSDHRITGVTMNNNASTLPTGAGIDVQNTASLVLDKLNIIGSNFPLNVSPASGVTVPSIKAINCFFDTSVVGLNMTGAGAVFRSEFTNCWFSSMSTAGIRIQPASGGSVDGVTFVNCDVYNNVAGTTNGILIGGSAGSVGKVKFVATTIAGWTTGVNISATTTSQYVTLSDCTIGATSAFGVNTTGISVATGTYKGLVIKGCDVEGNTTAITLGTVTVATWGYYRVIDNAGVNPRGTVTTPAVPASATAVTNTTGLRVDVFIKGGVTSVVTVNGVATPSVLAAGGNLPVRLEPGGTIAVTYTTAFTWVWVGQ